MAPIRVAIAGATGYAGQELIAWLLHHPNVRITCLAASAKRDGVTPLTDAIPRFARQLDLPIEPLNVSRLIDASDCVFLGLPHGAAMAVAPELLSAGKRVVDLSGDFRLNDPALYPTWYKFQHAHPELLGGGAVYGLTEFHRDQLKAATLVANPGCYATSVLLGVLPLFQAKLVSDGRVIVDAKSGLSGAGRKADESLLFTEMTENLRAYKVSEQQHMPEILQEIHGVTGQQGRLVFVPQVIPASRGLISTIYVRTDAAREAIEAVYCAAYPPERAPFVRVRAGGQLPELRDVVGTNYCDIGFVYDQAGGTLILASALDNLVKGAAGQAIQNFNVMHGLPETAGLA